MNETDAFHLITEFQQRIPQNRGIRLAVDKKEFRLTKEPGKPLPIKPTHFAVISWPKGTYLGFMGYKGVRDSESACIFDTITTDTEVNLLIATTGVKELEAVFERVFFSGDFEIVPGNLTGWVKGPEGKFFQYPIYEVE